jgi:drug/metabolite transporter (DMT)-like permease
VFSLASVFNLVLSATVLRQPFDKRILLAGFMGTLGIALMFAPEMGGHGLTRSAEVGLLQSLVATLSFCLANIISSASQRRGIPVLSSTAWGMLYGIGYLTLLSLAMGNAFIIDGTFHYLFALVWLALVASVIAFSSYLTVLGRIGPARAGYMAVLFPVVALIVSTLYEGYTWTVLAVIGLILVSVGNLIALRK